MAALCRKMDRLRQNEYMRDLHRAVSTRTLTRNPDLTSPDSQSRGGWLEDLLQRAELTYRDGDFPDIRFRTRSEMEEDGGEDQGGDEDGDEDDKLDEVIYPMDYDTAGYIVDDVGDACLP